MKQEEVKKFFQNKTNQYIFAGLILLVLFSFALNSEETTPEPQAWQADTVIPPNVTAIPIEISNQRSLSASIGQFAYVNVFSLKPDGRPGKRIGHKLKLLRAPLDQNEFLVLVPNAQEELFMQYTGPFFVSVLSRQNEEPSQISKRMHKTKRANRIEILEEDI